MEKHILHKKYIVALILGTYINVGTSMGVFLHTFVNYFFYRGSPQLNERGFKHI